MTPPLCLNWRNLFLRPMFLSMSSSKQKLGSEATNDLSLGVQYLHHNSLPTIVRSILIMVYFTMFLMKMINALSNLIVCKSKQLSHWTNLCLLVFLLICELLKNNKTIFLLLYLYACSQRWIYRENDGA